MAPTGLMALGGGILEARSKKVPNFPRTMCHSSHFFCEVKRLYLMLLKNSTSITWTSCTEMPDTSAQVLFVYVLSSKNLFPNIRATVNKRYSLPGLPLTVGFVSFNRYMKSNAKRITFCATCVVVRIVVTHFLKPVVGMSSGERGCKVILGEVPSTTCLRTVELSNQKRHVTCHVSKHLTDSYNNCHSPRQPTGAGPPGAC